jgi:competence protein ComEC
MLKLRKTQKPTENTHPEARMRLIPPAYYVPISFGAGISIVKIISLSFLVVSFVVFILMFLVAVSFRRTSFPLFCAALFLALGMLFGINAQTIQQSNVGLTAPEGWAVIDGNVLTVPDFKKYGKKETISFVLGVEDFYKRGVVTKATGQVQVFLHNPGRDVYFGDRLRIRGQFENPKPVRNPHVFDYAAYLAGNSIHKIFRGIGTHSILLQERGQANWALIKLNEFRVDLKQRVDRLFPFPINALSNALLLGFRKNIPNYLRDDFVKIGTAHLLAISGLHVSLLSGLVYLLGRLFGFPRQLNLILTILFILIYVILAGARVPVVRSGVMGLVLLSGLIFGHDRNMKSTFFVTLFLFLVVDSNLLFQVSFQLSFAAVGALIFVLPPLEHLLSNSRVKLRWNRWSPQWTPQRRLLAYLLNGARHLVIGSLAVTVGILPILVSYFHIFSLIGIFANLAAVPLTFLGMVMSVMVVMIDLIYSPLAEYVSAAPNAIFWFLIWLSHLLSQIPFGYFYLKEPTWYFLIGYYGTLAGLVATLRRPVQKWIKFSFQIGFVVIVSILFLGSRLHIPQILFFDVGPSNVAFVSFSDRSSFLINAGRQFPTDDAYWVTRPYLMGSGVKVLDSQLLTHLNGRSAGGAVSLSQHFKVKRIWLPSGSKESKGWGKYIEPVRGIHKRISFIKEKDQLQFGSSRHHGVKILAMDKGEIQAIFLWDRHFKLVYLTSTKARVFKTLLAQKELDADMIYLPNHDGIISDEERAFLKFLKPQFIILNEQRRVSEVAEVFGLMGDFQVFSLKQVGAVQFQFSKNERQVRTYASERAIVDEVKVEAV